VLAFELERDMNNRRQFLATNFKLAAGGVISSTVAVASLRSVLAQPAAPISSGSRLVLLGTTGGPPPKGQRSYAANALIVKGEQARDRVRSATRICSPRFLRSPGYPIHECRLSVLARTTPSLRQIVSDGARDPSVIWRTPNVSAVAYVEHTKMATEHRS
jgi:hypothetical protein